MTSVRPFLLLSLALIVALAGCGNPVPAPPVVSPPATEAPAQTQQSQPAQSQSEASPSVSPTATRAEETLDQAVGVQTPPMPDGHWLVGTSDVEDMVPAVMAPSAPRKLLASHGPAYLESIGDTRVLHLKGPHYEMGFQHGTLMKDEIQAAAALVSTVGALAWEKDYAASIREAWERTSPFIPEKYKEEIRGMAEATGLTLEQVQEFTIFPELFHCSGFALFGKATADGALLHGRVLDYMRDVGLDKYALIIVQEPDGANTFVNVAYSGMIGSVTGMNDAQVAVGEMGGEGAEKWDGFPMSLLVREILEKADTLDQARQIMQESARTCQYYYVISDAKADNGRGNALGVAAETDSILFIRPGEAHELLPRPMEDTVLMSAGGRYTCLADRVEKMYGQFTPELALDLMARGVAMKSNMHNALFRPETLEFWVANSTVTQPASNRPYTHYNLHELLEAKPSS